MIFKVVVAGYFQNVKGITALQQFPVLLQCTCCGEEHGKYVTVAPSGAAFGSGTSVSCKKCHGAMFAASQMPQCVEARCIDAESGKEISVQIVPCRPEPAKEELPVSLVKTEGCRVVEIPHLEISVLTKRDTFFRDILIEEGFWEGGNGTSGPSTLDFYEIAVRGAVEDAPIPVAAGNSMEAA